MEMNERLLAITDIETTGLDPIGHEIIEIGLIIADQKTLEIKDIWSVKVKPEHIETATTEALAINGYTEEDWKEAYNLRVAMMAYRKKTKDAIFVAHNICFDWSFIYEAFTKCELDSLMDYHRIDLFSLAWLLLSEKLPKINLVSLCEYFNIPKEPDPHQAVFGAKKALEVLRKLKNMEIVI